MGAVVTICFVSYEKFRKLVNEKGRKGKNQAGREGGDGGRKLKDSKYNRANQNKRFVRKLKPKQIDYCNV